MMKLLVDYRMTQGGIGVYSRYLIAILNDLYGEENVTLLVLGDPEGIRNPIIKTKIRPYSFLNFFTRRINKSYDYYVAPSYTFFNVLVSHRLMIVHDLAVLLDKNYFADLSTKILGILRWKIYFTLLNLVNYKIYGISDTTIKDIEKCWKIMPFGVLENVVEVTESELFNEIGTNDRFSVFYFGNARRHKNLQRLFRLAEKNPNVQFKLAGSCCDEEEFNWNLANVERLGFLDDRALSRHLQQVDASILLSTYEGFGRGVVESLLHGTPVLINRGGALKELQDNGIVTLERDDDFLVALSRARFVKLHDLINRQYWKDKYSYRNVKSKLRIALKC